MGKTCNSSRTVGRNSRRVSERRTLQRKDSKEDFYITHQTTNGSTYNMLWHNQNWRRVTYVPQMTFDDRDENDIYDDISEMAITPRKEVSIVQNGGTNLLGALKQPNNENVSSLKRMMTMKIMDKVKAKILMMYALEVSELTYEQKKADRQRIQDEYEEKVLQSLNDDEFELKIFKPSMGYQAFNKFKNMNEMIEMSYCQDEIISTPKIVNQEQIQSFRVVLVIHKGKTVASGCIMINQEPFSVASKEDYKNLYKVQQNRATCREKDLNQNDQDEIKKVKKNDVYKGLIQYIMMDEDYLNSTDPLQTIQKLMSGLEAIAWLHNCIKVQVQKGILNKPMLSDCEYWMVTRGNNIIFNRNKDLSMETMSQQTLKLIHQSNQESIQNYKKAPVE